jgi:hypothetical protein
VDALAVSVFALSAIGPVVAAALVLFNQAVQLGVRFVLRTVFVSKSVHDEFSLNVLLRFLTRSAKGIGVDDQVYSASRHHIRLEDRERLVFWRRTQEGHRLFSYKGAPILLMPAHTTPNDTFSRASFQFLRGTINWDRLLEEAGRHYDDYLSEIGTARKFRVVRHTGNGRKSVSNSDDDFGNGNGLPKSENPHNVECNEPVNWNEADIGPPGPEDPLEHLSIGEAMRRVIQDARFWFKHRSWYRERDVTWRRGYLLYGRPGTGKTSLVRALAQELDLVIHTFDLSSMSNRDFVNAWRRSQQDSPRVVLLEDFDAVFNGRENVVGSELTFDTILNAIDGVERENGLLLFVTTNNVDAIDAALGAPDGEGRSTRPGRIDMVVELPALDHGGRLKIARRILRDDGAAEKLALIGSVDTAAQFQERCVRQALQELWGETAVA